METTGHIKTLEVDIEELRDFKIDYRELNIFVGKNGVGKTLMMTFVWVLNTILQYKVANPSFTDIQLKENAQYTFDKSFEQNNFTGFLELEAEKGIIGIEIEKGKILDINVVIENSVDTVFPSIYMSKDIRLITAMDNYLKLRKTIGGDKDLEKMTKFYKLYDIMYVESVLYKIASCKNIIPQGKRDILKNFEIDLDIQYIVLDSTEEHFCYLDSKNNINPLSILSAGEQSLINMILIANL